MRTRVLMLALPLLLATACGSTVRVQNAAESARGAPDLPGSTGEFGSPGTASTRGNASTPGDTLSGATTSAAAGSGASPNSPGSAPGGPIKVGIPYIDQQQSNAIANSIDPGLSTGDTKAAVEALIADLNARGGILGRKVEPVYHVVDFNSAPEVQQQAACEAFTSDTRVPYVLGFAGQGPGFWTCMAKAGVGVVFAGASSQLLSRSQRKYPGLLLPDTISLDRISRLQAAGFSKLGFFGNPTTARVGVVYYDEPEFAPAEKELEAALAERGITVAARSGMSYVGSTGDVGRTCSDIPNAVLQFRSAGVTHVLFVEDNSWLNGCFTLAAGKQDYYPRRGLTSQEPLGNHAEVQTARSMEGTLVLGWNPIQDVADLKQMPAAGQRCLKSFAGKQPTESFNQRTNLVTVCESVNFFVAALTAAGSWAGARSLVAGASRLRGYESGKTFSIAIGSDRPDGVAAIRDGKWDPACPCFVYTSAPHPL